MEATSTLSRRSFLSGGAIAAATIAFPASARAWLAAAEPGRLTARPGKPTRNVAAGSQVLRDDDGRRSVLHVPPGYDPRKRAPFLLALHGASSSGDAMLRGTQAASDAHGVVVLSPSSRGGTWDAIRGRFSSDVELIDRQLAEVFDRCAVDPARVAVCGFSDGATYALSLGLINGDLFTHIIAHSPGFVVPGTLRGQPKIFVSHGRNDRVLPIDQCSRRIVPMLERAGYSPRYDEFEGGHVASPEMRETAMSWFTS